MSSTLPGSQSRSCSLRERPEPSVHAGLKNTELALRLLGDASTRMTFMPAIHGHTLAALMGAFGACADLLISTVIQFLITWESGVGRRWRSEGIGNLHLM